MSIKQNFPEVSPSLLLDFANSRTLDPKITFTRASVGTYVASNGLIKTAAADEARFDHDTETGESLGLLIEESRTNLVTYSEDISTWGKSNVAVSSQSVSNPFGYSNVYRVRGSSSLNRGHSVGPSPSVSVPANTLHTTSVYVKGEGTGSDAGKIQIRIGGIGFRVGVVNFDLFSNQSSAPQGLSGTSSSSDTWSINDYGMQPVGDGWYRIWMTHESNATSSVGFLNITSLSAKDHSSLSRTFWYTASNTGGFYMVGAQVEAGSFKTSYIPTSGSTVTRAQDTTKITGTNFTDFYNQSEGSFSAQFKGGQRYNLNNTTDQWSRVVGYKSGTNHTFLSSHTGGTNRYHTYNGPNQVNQINGPEHISEFAKASVGYGTDTLSLATKIDVSSGSFITPTDVDAIFIGNDGSSQYPLNGYIKQLSYYPKRLTDAQLQNLTK